MSRLPGDHPLVAIVGPTGSGKSELALRVAEEFAARSLVAIRCRSIAISTSARPSSESRKGAAFRTICWTSPNRTRIFSAGEFARRSRGVLEEITARGRLPIVAGGTGFYLRALVDGLFPGTGAQRHACALGWRSERSKRPGSLAPAALRGSIRRPRGAFTPGMFASSSARWRCAC